MKFKEGTKVRIISSKYTSDEFGTGVTMKKMIGKIFKAESCVKCDDDYNCVSLDGWCWDSRDVIPLNENKKPLPKPELFDIKNLSI
jgi:hypothetical protein